MIISPRSLRILGSAREQTELFGDSSDAMHLLGHGLRGIPYKGKTSDLLEKLKRKR
jgi:hypothetical protein